MIFVLGYLPKNTEEKDIRELLHDFAAVSEVVFFDKPETCCHSEYECMVTLKFVSRIAGCAIQNRLHNYCWKGCRIHLRMLIF